MKKQIVTACRQVIPAVTLTPSTNAVILAEIHGHNFGCCTDSGADDVGISNTLVKFLGEKALLPTNGRSFMKVDGHAIKSLRQVQISPKLNSVAETCRFRKMEAFVMPCNETLTAQGAAYAGEIRS